MSRYGVGMKVQPVGILGGGQLARMLALAAHPLGIEPHILASSATEPAAQVTSRTQVGTLEDGSDLKTFLSQVDVLTFESEFVNTELLRGCLKGTRTKVFPSLDILSQIQDRKSQKELLAEHGIATSPWMTVSGADELKTALKRFAGGFVLKQRRFGYDGYGTFMIDSARDLRPEILSKSAHGFIAERKIAFRRELAVSFVRSRSGTFLSLPLVETVQQNARCFSVRGPVVHPGLARLERAFKKLMSACDYVGILAVELFESPNRREGYHGLLVNELAPRVHNSAHYSQNALTCDQFSYHLRAILDLPLPKVERLRPGFAMVNLLGEGHRQVNLSTSAVGHLHWYGKSENREGRKLGHLNVLDRTPASALRRALRWRKEFVL